MKKVFMAAWLALAALFVAIPVQAVPARWIPTNAINLLDQSAQALTITGTTADTNFASVNIPGNTISVDGALRIRVHLNASNNANNKSINVRLGGVSVAGMAITTHQNTMFEIVVYARQGYQHVITRIQTASGYSSYSVGSPALDMTADKALTIACALAVASDSCYLDAYSVEVIRP